MSAGDSIPLAQARAVADELVALLAPGCDRIEIAGSIRRERAEVHDIEIVAAPTIAIGADGLWGEPIQIDRLDQWLAPLRIVGTLSLRDVVIRRKDGTSEISHRDGDAYKALMFRGLPVDLFIVRPPADWGVIYAIRTGPGDWNEKIVTDCQRYFRRVAGGQVLHLGTPVPCPEEADFFRAVGQPWFEPRDRRIERVHIVPPHTLDAAAR